MIRCARQRRTTRASTATAVLCLVVLLGSAACSGDPATGVLGSSAQFVASASVLEPDLVKLDGRTIDDSTVEIEIRLGGPSDSDQLYAFSFDLVFSNPDFLHYLSGTLEPGNVLQPTGPQSVLVLAQEIDDRLIVGVSKSGGGTGNGFTLAEGAVARLRFAVPSNGTTTIIFAGSPANPANPTNHPAAFNSGGAVLTSVRFDAAPARIVR